VKNINKKFAFAIVTLTLIGFGVVVTSRVFAQDTNSPQTIVQKIADKFGLKTSDVQAVFDQNRTDRRAEMETKFEEQLTAAVKDGKLTEEQKQLILAKRKELQNSRQDFKNWATQNGIDIKYLMGGFGMRGGHGPGGPPKPSPTQ
jgi:hypothetical protein